MDDFQYKLKRILFEAEEAELTPIGAPDKFNIGHHDTGMKKAGESGAASEVIQKHLEAQAFEFKKLKTAYDELVKTVNEVFSKLGTYGIEDKGFMKGKMQPMAVPPHLQQQGQPSGASTAQAMGQSAFRQRMQTPITPNVDDL
jgi:hypothetical protein